MFKDFRGRRVTVMGLGRFGGGTGAVRFLVERGARVTVTDLADEKALASSLDELADLKIDRLRLGGHSAEDFQNAELVVASPAVRIDHPLLVEAASKGVPISTEIGLVWSHCRGRIIGVTGSVGKSTTTAMIHAILSRSSGRRAWIGGNIGGSLLGDVERISPDDWVVLELSSFQLEYLAPLRPKPAISVVTNLRPNHLDRHGTLEAYRAAKQTLLRWQAGDDATVLNANDVDLSSWPMGARVFWFGGEREGVTKRERTYGVFADGGDLIFRVGRIPIWLEAPLRLPGEHHRQNASAAAAAAIAAGMEPQEITRALSEFPGLPHRLEVVGEFAGRLWVDDSKATTPESAIAALQSFDRPIRLIAGGADKGVDLSSLASEIVSRRVAAYLSGFTGPTLASLLTERGHRDPVVRDSFDASVAAAWTDSRPGDVILLSPACASWGQFRDYRERGERFASLAFELTAIPRSENSH